MRVGMIVLFAMLYVGLGLFLYLGKKRQSKVLLRTGIIGLIVALIITIYIVITYA